MSMALAAIVSTLALSSDASAFTHVVRKGETLASIAKSIYGRADLEHVLVGANALDAQGGSAIAPGMRLEIPSVGHQRTGLGDTWNALADRWLGDSRYSSVLAEANGTHSWLPPDPGAEVVIPYVLRHYAAADETIFDVSQRYLGDKMLAWQLVVFNDLKGNDIRRGDVVLIPLVNLPLTPAGEAEAITEKCSVDASGDMLGPMGVGGGHVLGRQRAIEEKLPDLYAHVSAGRWVEAVALGNKMLGIAQGPRSQTPVDIGRSQLARIGKLLTTAFVALDATGAARDACKLYLDNVVTPHLEPSSTSPKVREACGRP